MYRCVLGSLYGVCLHSTTCICLSSTAFPCANNVVHGYMIDSYGPVVTYIEDIMDDHGTLVLQYWGL